MLMKPELDPEKFVEEFFSTGKEANTENRLEEDYGGRG